jgi:hypothetical protein
MDGSSSAIVAQIRADGRAGYPSRVDPLSAARPFLPSWLPFVSLLALPLGGVAGWLARKRTRFAAVLASSVVGALFAHLGGPLSLLGPAATGFLGSAAALAGYALGSRRAPAPPAGRIAGKVALFSASVLVLAAAEAGRSKAMAEVGRRSPLAAVALTGGEAGHLAELARARDAGGKPEDAVAFYRAAYSLDGRPGHLANAAFVESHAGRCDSARALAAEAGRAAQRAGTAAWDRHLAARAADVAARCGEALRAADDEE